MKVTSSRPVYVDENQPKPSNLTKKIAKIILAVAPVFVLLHILGNVPTADAGFGCFAVCMPACLAGTLGGFPPACVAACAAACATNPV